MLRPGPASTPGEQATVQRSTLWLSPRLPALTADGSWFPATAGHGGSCPYPPWPGAEGAESGLGAGQREEGDGADAVPRAGLYSRNGARQPGRVDQLPHHPGHKEGAARGAGPAIDHHLQRQLFDDPAINANADLSPSGRATSSGYSRNSPSRTCRTTGAWAMTRAGAPGRFDHRVPPRPAAATGGAFRSTTRCSSAASSISTRPSPPT